MTSTCGIGLCCMRSLQVADGVCVLTFHFLFVIICLLNCLGAHKEIERAFGCLPLRLYILIKKIKYFFKDNIEPFSSSSRFFILSAALNFFILILSDVETAKIVMPSVNANTRVL
jgi:hypothetical protein